MLFVTHYAQISQILEKEFLQVAAVDSSNSAGDGPTPKSAKNAKIQRPVDIHMSFLESRRNVELQDQDQVDSALDADKDILFLYKAVGFAWSTILWLPTFSA
jgi:hypothetical protein